MGRLLIIGIDGLDYDYISNAIENFPNFKRLSQIGCLKPLRSVFPPDSIPAWVSIFTGLPPVEHGIVDSVDYLEKNYKNFSVDASSYAGKTFWDIIGNSGHKVCVLNPFMAYPTWPVNGAMASGSVFVDGNNQSYPLSFFDDYPSCPPLGGIEDNPRANELGAFVQKTHSDAQELADFSYDVLSKETWDLGFVSFFTMDRIQHFLWRYCHNEDPTYPGINNLETAIADHYKIFDNIVGQFLGILKDDDKILVISDHGHGMRCTHTLNLNEFLRQKGYLRNDCGRYPLLSKKYWLEKTKNTMIALLYNLELEEYIYKIGKYLPNRKKLKSGEHVINQSTSLARVPKFAGCGPYSGVEISNHIKKEDYRTLCNKIIDDLNEFNSIHGGKLFKWIKHRDFLQGASTAYLYPDILFELYPQYGASWSLFVPIISKNYFHRRLSGGHKWYGVYASNINEGKSSLEVCDIFSIALSHFNLIKN